MTMGVRQYNIGKKHALAGIRAMAHRKLRQYDSRSAQESYYNGYSAGTKERMTRTGKVPLDYSNPLNNQLFMKAL
jgi:hypothetical protein